MVSRSAAVEEYFQPKVVAPADFLRGIDVGGRAVPSRLRRDEDEAAAGAGDPRERARRADPRAVARGARLVARLDERREEPLGRRVAALAGYGPVLGAARARAHAAEAPAAARHARRDRSRDGHVHAALDAIGGDDTFQNGLDGKLDDRDPRPAASRGDPMKQTAPGRYEADFPLDRYGLVPAARDAREADRRRQGRRAAPRVAESFGHVTNPYPREYLALAPDVVDALARPPWRPAGSSIRTRGACSIRRASRSVPRGSLAALRGAAIAVFLLDLLLRRVRLFDRKKMARGARASNPAGRPRRVLIAPPSSKTSRPWVFALAPPACPS